MDAQAASSSHFINFGNDGSQNAVVTNANLFNDEDEEEVDPTMLCRICSATCKTFMPIYEGEGLENKLAKKINNYLPITVDDGDYLPDKICTVCVNTLIAWDELVQCCIKSNATLSEMLDKADNINIFKVKPVKTKTVVNGKSKSRERKSTIKHKRRKRNSSFRKSIDIGNLSSDEDLSVANNYSSDDSQPISRLMLKMKRSDSKFENESSNLDFMNSDSEFNCKFFSTDSDTMSENTGRQIESDKNKEVFCHLCKMNTVAKTYIKHIQNHLNENHRSTCEQCGKSFSNVRNFNRHVKQFHEKVRYPCDVCSKTFITNFALKEHKRLHNGLRPYMCHSCGKSFNTRNGYIFHCRRHSLMKYKPEHVCPNCPKRFLHKIHLDRHSIVHSDDRPYPCSLCKRKFKTPRCVKSHMRKHIEKPCKQVFTLNTVDS